MQTRATFYAWTSFRQRLRVGAGLFFGFPGGGGIVFGALGFFGLVRLIFELKRGGLAAWFRCRSPGFLLVPDNLGDGLRASLTVTPLAISTTTMFSSTRLTVPYILPR